jgi:D-lactate dehydrogenase
LVVNRFDGALKAEHGTGRNMAPFVETEWGAEAYEIMRQVKSLADPTGLLNPGVIINSDPLAHLHDLKQLPTVEPEIDKCIECGYCEPRCPSRDITLTPRQRIVVRREMARQQQLGGSDYLYNWIAIFPTWRSTPAPPTDSAPPPARSASIPASWSSAFARCAIRPSPKSVARFTVDNFSLVESLVRLGLGTAHIAERILGLRAMQTITGAMRKVIGPNMPRVERRDAPPRPRAASRAPTVSPPKPSISPHASRGPWDAFPANPASCL